MLHCGNEFWMEPWWFSFKFDDMVLRMGRITSSYDFVAGKYTCFGTSGLFKKGLFDMI